MRVFRALFTRRSGSHSFDLLPRYATASRGQSAQITSKSLLRAFEQVVVGARCRPGSTCIAMSQHADVGAVGVRLSESDPCSALVCMGYVACAPARCRSRLPVPIGKQAPTLWLVGSAAAELTVLLAAHRVQVMISIQSQVVVNCSAAETDQQGNWHPRIMPRLLTPEHTCSCSLLSLETVQARCCNLCVEGTNCNDHCCWHLAPFACC